MLIPSCLQAFLGAQESEVAGVVLHSPLLSGIRVLSPGLKWWPAFADVYPNHLLVPKINAPTLVMHVSCSIALYGTCTLRMLNRGCGAVPRKGLIAVSVVPEASEKWPG
jgi:hypothetical protein